jgi:tRNA (guanine37-N1)-methyltransferase
MTIIDATIRLVPGVLGDEDSSASDSFSGEGRLLESAQYTRPRVFRGFEVPEVLLSGNHEEIARWRKEDARRRTQSRRADLLGENTIGPPIKNKRE